jgi:hypothetical protein
VRIDFTPPFNLCIVDFLCSEGVVGMKGAAVGSGSVATLGQPLAIVMMVLILGSSAYMWRQGYLRSRAAVITLIGVVAILVYFGFFAKETVAAY